MKRRILFTLLSLAALAALVWLLLPARHPPEPVYKGKPLRHWLALYSLGSGFGSSPADEAVRQIGTNAIPTLLEMLQEHDSPLKLKWIALLEKQHVFRPPQPAAWHNNQAVLAFYALGATASNAVPTLLQIYHRKISIYFQRQAFDALYGIGPAAFPAANPVFLDALSSTNLLFRQTVARAICQAHPQPDVFVPALINALKDSDWAVRFWIAQALGKYGPAAKPAVPALVALLNDPNPYVRAAATNALKAIDPSAAANAGIK